jgi:hypothetical protein
VKFVKIVELRDKRCLEFIVVIKDVSGICMVMVAGEKIV